MTPGIAEDLAQMELSSTAGRCVNRRTLENSEASPGKTEQSFNLVVSFYTETSAHRH